jgi:hypothetical protein
MDYFDQGHFKQRYFGQSYFRLTDFVAEGVRMILRRTVRVFNGVGIKVGV